VKLRLGTRLVIQREWRVDCRTCAVIETSLPFRDFVANNGERQGKRVWRDGTGRAGPEAQGILYPGKRAGGQQPSGRRGEGVAADQPIMS